MRRALLVLAATAADEARMGPPGRKNTAADRVCFRYLKGSVNTKPISKRGRARMAAIMRGLARCMRRHGYALGQPNVKNLSRGRVALLFPDVSPRAGRAGDAGVQAGAT